MQNKNLCEPYLNSHEVIRIVQSNNQTFLNRVLKCIGDSKTEICRHILTTHPLIATDLLLLLRDDAFQQAQMALLKAIHNGTYTAITDTCLPFLSLVFRRAYWKEYQKELLRKKGLEKLTPPPPVEIKDSSPDYHTYRVQQLVQELSPTDRQLYQLRYVDGLKIKEIAALLHIETDSVKKKLQRLHNRFESLWQ